MLTTRDMQLALALAAVTWALASNASDGGSIQFAEYVVEQTGNVQYRSLKEASGIAQSTRDEKILWSHNDSGYGPFLFAFSPSGKHLARVFVEQATMRDWEDMAAFRWRDKSWLAIADTGDNAGMKPTSLVHIVEEPVIEFGKPPATIRVKVGWSITFQYPEGPADCESIAVDAQDEKIYLLTKRNNPPRLYSVPLQNIDPAKTVRDATLEGEVRTIPRPTAREIIEYPSFGLHRSQPTAMDFSADRSFAIVNTYGYAYRFDRRNDESWIEALNSTPLRIIVPPMNQPEAVAVATDHRGLFFTSEGVRPPIFYLRPKPAHHKEPGEAP